MISSPALREYRLGAVLLLGASCALVGLAVSVSPTLTISFAILVVFVVCSALSPKLAVALWLGVLCLIPTWFGVNQFGMFLEVAAIASMASMPALVVHRRHFKFSSVDLMIAAAIGLAGLAVIFADSQIVLFRDIVLLGGFPYLIARVLTPAVGSVWLYRVFSFAMVGLATWAIFEYAFDFHPFQSFFPGSPTSFWSEILFRAGAARSEVTFGHPIALGGAIAMAIPLTLGSDFRPATKIAFLSVLGLGILTTASRGPLLAALMGVLLMLVTRGQGKQIRGRPVILLILGILGFLFLLLLAPSLSTDSEAVVSAEGRSNLYSTLLPTINVLGPGDNFSFDITGAINSYGFTSIDSTFLQLGLAFGWLPVAIIIVGLALNALTVVRGRSTPAGVALLAMLPVLLTVAPIGPLQPLLWFLAGVTVATNLELHKADRTGLTTA